MKYTIYVDSTGKRRLKSIPVTAQDNITLRLLEEKDKRDKELRHNYWLNMWIAYRKEEFIRKEKVRIDREYKKRIAEKDEREEETKTRRRELYLKDRAERQKKKQEKRLRNKEKRIEKIESTKGICYTNNGIIHTYENRHSLNLESEAKHKEPREELIKEVPLKPWEDKESLICSPKLAEIIDKEPEDIHKIILTTIEEDEDELEKVASNKRLSGLKKRRCLR